MTVYDDGSGAHFVKWGELFREGDLISLALDFDVGRSCLPSETSRVNVGGKGHIQEGHT